MTFTLRTVSQHRSFAAVCLGIVDARSFVQQKDGELRPALITFACSAQVFRPFVANVYERRALELHYENHRNEPLPVGLLKSAGYELATQLVPGRTGHDEEGNPTQEPDRIIGTFYVPRVFALDPPSVEDSMCEFVLLPTREQLEANAAALDNKAIVTHLFRTGRTELPTEWLRYIGALSCLWAGYVDRRVHAPIIQEPAFFAHALYDALKAGFVEVASAISPTSPGDVRGRHYGYWEKKSFPAESASLRTYGLDALGFAPFVLHCRATEDKMQELLAESIKSYSTMMAVNSGAVQLPEGL